MYDLSRDQIRLVGGAEPGPHTDELYGPKADASKGFTYFFNLCQQAIFDGEIDPQNQAGFVSCVAFALFQDKGATNFSDLFNNYNQMGDYIGPYYEPHEGGG